MKRIALFAVCALALCSFSVDAGPRMGRAGAGGCGAGGCGGGSSSMMGGMMSSGSWGSAMPAHVAPAAIEVVSNRSLDFFVNAERARAGLPPVTVSATMNAQLQAALTEKAGAGVLEKTDLPYKQNLARGSTSAREIVQAWMNKPELAANILAADYRTCGFASVKGADGKTYWALAMGK